MSSVQFRGASAERVIRTFKEDLVWPREFDSVQAFEAALKQWVKDYNEDFPHSALNYETPCDYERWFYASLSKINPSTRHYGFP